MTAPHPIEVYDLRRTCLAAPSQWEGRVGEHGSIYIRYRWGKLRARVSWTTPEASAHGVSIFEDDIGSRTGNKFDGFMETEEMQQRLAHVCRFHGPCDEDAWDPPLTAEQSRALQALMNLGDRRSATLEQSEAVRHAQHSEPTAPQERPVTTPKKRDYQD